jgi:hypothetical protein
MATIATIAPAQTDITVSSCIPIGQAAIIICTTGSIAGLRSGGREIDIVR